MSFDNELHFVNTNNLCRLCGIMVSNVINARLSGYNSGIRNYLAFQSEA